MRSHLARYLRRLRSHPARTTITLRWNELSPVQTDPTTGDQLGTAVAKTKEVKALVHFVAPTTSGVRMFAEIQAGDAIIDFDPDVDLENKPGLVFSFAGQDWVQQKVGKDVEASWDAYYG